MTPKSLLKKVYETRAIAVPCRFDVLAFTFESAEKKPTGYTVDLCPAVIANIERPRSASFDQRRGAPVKAPGRRTSCRRTAGSVRNSDCLRRA